MERLKECSDLVNDVLEKLWIMNETNGEVKTMLLYGTEHWKEQFEKLTLIDKMQLLLRKGTVKQIKGTIQYVEVSIFGEKHTISIANDGEGIRLALVE